jgi:hypothetical protein
MLIATETFFPEVDGLPVTVSANETRVMSDHSLALRFPQWFKPITPHFGELPKVEQATAAPGETRE